MVPSFTPTWCHHLEGRGGSITWDLQQLHPLQRDRGTRRQPGMRDASRLCCRAGHHEVDSMGTCLASSRSFPRKDELPWL